MDVKTIPGLQIAPKLSEGKTEKTGLAGLADYQNFLKLFVTQLKYQDPLSPASQDEFLAQTAQFSSVEQLMQLNQKMGDLAEASRMSAASLIGRKVEGRVTGADGAKTKVAGIVHQLDYGENGHLILELQDGTTLPLADVESIIQA